MKNWILSVVAVAFFSYIAKILMPNGKTKKILTFILSAIAVLVIASPLVKIKDMTEVPTVDIDYEYEEFDEKCRQDFYLSMAKSKLKMINISLQSADFEFNDKNGEKTLKKINIYFDDLVIIGDNRHINISSETKKALADLFSLPEEDIIISGGE